MGGIVKEQRPLRRGDCALCVFKDLVQRIMQRQWGILSSRSGRLAGLRVDGVEKGRRGGETDSLFGTSHLLRLMVFDVHHKQIDG